MLLAQLFVVPCVTGVFRDALDGVEDGTCIETEEDRVGYCSCAGRPKPLLLDEDRGERIGGVGAAEDDVLAVENGIDERLAP